MPQTLWSPLWQIFDGLFSFCENLKQRVTRGAAKAQWIRLQLPSWCPGFESQAHHLCFHQFIKVCNVENDENNKKRAGLAHLTKTLTILCYLASFWENLNLLWQWLFVKCVICWTAEYYVFKMSRAFIGEKGLFFAASH